MKIISLICFLYIMGVITPVNADDKLILETSYQILHIIDWAQTRQVAKQPDKYYEMNPIFGKHPSVDKVDIFMAGFAVLHLITSYNLPEKLGNTNPRKIFQYGTLGIKIFCVGNNFSIGLTYKF